MENVPSFQGNGPFRTFAGLRVLSLMLATFLCALPCVATPSEDQVRHAAEVLYIHGMTDEIANREIGLSGVPLLLGLLWDPEFEHRDNVVAFLAYLGDANSVPELLRFAEQQPFAISAPEEDRALLLVPEALGRIFARTGDTSALQTLLTYTSGDAVRDPGLVEMAIRGLMLSGADVARARLEAIAERRIVPAIGLDLSKVASTSLAWLARTNSQADTTRPTLAPQEESGLSGRTTPRSLEFGALPEEAPVSPADFDTNPLAHDLLIKYANHVSLAAQYRMNDARLDEMLEVATQLVGLADFATDVACCATLTRSAPGSSFGVSGDGLDVITTEGELTAVLTDPIARVKVVRQVSWCGGGPTTNTIGCAYIAGYGMALVRYGSLTREAVLWTHEFGHNLGLVHVDDGRYIMHYSIDAVGGLYANECRNFHWPPQATSIDPVNIGLCEDDDGDGRHVGIDNCPDEGNADQADHDGDGAGDACDNCLFNFNPGQHDDDNDSFGDHCDNCIFDANADQNDVDRDEIGDVCDNCPALNNPGQEDGDFDFVGDLCDNCLTERNPDQENSDADALGDACDNCPLQFNPSQADFDGDSVGDLCEVGAVLSDADGSGRVDGFDLARLGRAFGSYSPDPNYEVSVDLDRNGRVDGEDLAIFAGYFGDLVD